MSETATLITRASGEQDGESHQVRVVSSGQPIAEYDEIGENATGRQILIATITVLEGAPRPSVGDRLMIGDTPRLVQRVSAYENRAGLEDIFELSLSV